MKLMSDAYEAGGKIRFKCVRCDVCCGTGPNVTITIYDLVRISERLNIHPRVVLEQLMNLIIADLIPYITLGNDQWGRCAFLGYNELGETYCRVYEARPYRCRIYPAQIQGLRRELRVDSKCPGLGKGDETLLADEVEVDGFLREMESHYRAIYHYVFERRLPPLRALYEAIDEYYRSLKKDNSK